MQAQAIPQEVQLKLFVEDDHKEEPKFDPVASLLETIDQNAQYRSQEYGKPFDEFYKLLLKRYTLPAISAVDSQMRNLQMVASYVCSSGSWLRQCQHLSPKDQWEYVIAKHNSFGKPNKAAAFTAPVKGFDE